MFTRCLSLCFAALLAAGCEREARRFPERPSPRKQYLNNAFEVANGQRLFSVFNCNGCHGNGGGGMGPPLMDRKWIYGGDPQTIFTTIFSGRPNGMPAFGKRLPEHQIWELVGYVRSMSGQARLDVAPGRTDHMHPREPEVMRSHLP